MRLQLTLMSAILFCVAILSSAQSAYAGHLRPGRGENSDQLNNYLKELQEYYSVYGRGRFGKRQMHYADTSVIFKKMPYFEYNKQDNVFKSLTYK